MAEDTSVLDHMSGGRLEVGVGPGGNHAAFGCDPADRHRLTSEGLELLRTAWRGEELPGGDRLYPANPGLADRLWQATFSVEGGRRAGADGAGVLLSRTQPRPKDRPDMTVAEIQEPILDAYYAALKPGVAPRVLALRSVFMADSRAEAMRLAEIGLRKARARHGLSGGTPAEWLMEANSHVGTADEVAESLAADAVMARATELSVQVHSIDPPHPLILRSLELMAKTVAPALGWPGPAGTTEERRAA